MKNLLTLLLVLTAFVINAQSDSSVFKMDTTLNKIDTAESTEFEFGNVKVIIKDKNKKVITKDDNLNEEIEKEEKSEFPKVSFNTSFGIGVTGYSQKTANVLFITAPDVTTNASVDLDYGKSRNYMINGNLMFDIHKNFGILTGLGVEFKQAILKALGIPVTLDAVNSLPLEQNGVAFSQIKLV